MRSYIRVLCNVIVMLGDMEVRALTSNEEEVASEDATAVTIPSDVGIQQCTEIGGTFIRQDAAAVIVGRTGRYEEHKGSGGGPCEAVAQNLGNGFAFVEKNAETRRVKDRKIHVVPIPPPELPLGRAFEAHTAIKGKENPSTCGQLRATR